MFWRKQTIKDMQAEISVLRTRQFKLRRQVTEFEQKIKQLECKHDFKFNRYWVGYLGNGYVYHKCIECNKETAKRWDNVARKGQQALRLLNLIPKDWKIKGDKK